MTDTQLQMESLWAKNMGKYEAPPPVPDLGHVDFSPTRETAATSVNRGSSGSDPFGWMLLALSALCGLGCSASIICSYLMEGVNLYGAVPFGLLLSVTIGLMGSFAIKELNIDAPSEQEQKINKILNEYNEALRKGS